MSPVIQTILDKIQTLVVNLPTERTDNADTLASVSQNILKELDLPGQVSVTKRYPAYVEYIFWLDNQEVTSYRVFARDGRMGTANVLLCIEDVINEAVGREHPELITEIQNTLQVFPSPYRWVNAPTTNKTQNPKQLS